MLSQSAGDKGRQVYPAAAILIAAVVISTSLVVAPALESARTTTQTSTATIVSTTSTTYTVTVTQTSNSSFEPRMLQACNGQAWPESGKLLPGNPVVLVPPNS